MYILLSLSLSLLLLLVVVVVEVVVIIGILVVIDRGPRTVPSIAGHARTQRVESHTATFYDSNRTSGRVKHRPARYETKVGTPISSRSRGKHRAQRRLQLWFLEKRKRAERNRGSQKHQKDSVKLFKVAFRVGESTCCLEE